MTPARFLALSLAPPLALALAACGGTGDEAEGERKTAAGEVLGGSINDDMLPLDTVTSQSPSLRERGNGSPAGSDDEGSAPADADTPADDAASAPAPEPSAAPAAETPE
jgi:hypothetical protein